MPGPPVLGGQDGKGVCSTAGGITVTVSGGAITGEALTIAVTQPGAGLRVRNESLAYAVTALAVCAGKDFLLSGVQFLPDAPAMVRLEFPARVNVGAVSVHFSVSPEGNYTLVPWKLAVPGSTAYASMILSGNGTVFSLQNILAFSDILRDFRGMSSIGNAADNRFFGLIPMVRFVRRKKSRGQNLPLCCFVLAR